MAGGFGFQRYPMAPSPPPNEVGSALESQMLAGQQPGYHTPGYLPSNSPSVGAALMAPQGPPMPQGAPGMAGVASDAPEEEDGLEEPQSIGGALMGKPSAKHAAMLLRHGVPPEDVQGQLARGAI